MDDKLTNAKNILKKYSQEHLLYFYNELSTEEQETLINQILNTDFEKIINLYNNSKINEDLSNIDISPLPHIEKEELSPNKLNYYTQIGETIIRNNEVAVITMAGRSRNKTWS